MALSSCFVRSPFCFSLGIDGWGRSSSSRSFKNGNGVRQRCNRYLGMRSWNFRKRLLVSASLMGSSNQIAASAFTWGTVAVLPCYTFMVVAPHAHLTKKIVGSSIPYIILGILYAYLLYRSWTPDTIRYMFASKY